MAELGFFGMLVPGTGTATPAAICLTPWRWRIAANGACSTIMSVHNSVACMPILKFGTDEQKERFLRPLARGEHIGGFALTEPQAGSDASSLRTRARRDGDHYVINGAKQFITSGRSGQTVIVFAVTDPDAGKRGISAFIVPTDTGLPGRACRGQARTESVRHLPDRLRGHAHPGRVAAGRGRPGLQDRAGQP